MMTFKEYKKKLTACEIRETRFDPEDEDGSCIVCGARRSTVWPEVLQSDGSYKTEKIIIASCGH